MMTILERRKDRWLLFLDGGCTICCRTHLAAVIIRIVLYLDEKRGEKL